jgi:hypothetical protein
MSAHRTAAAPIRHISTPPSAVEAVWIAGLLAVFGSHAAIRRQARAIFLHGAQWAVWGLLHGSTTPRVSLSFLQRITAQAASHLFERWSHQSSGSAGSFLLELRRALDDVMFGRVDDADEQHAHWSAGGVLSRVSDHERRMLVERVRGQLTPRARATLLIALEVNPWGADGAVNRPYALRAAECELENALLAGIAYDLGMPAGNGWRLTAA